MIRRKKGKGSLVGDVTLVGAGVLRRFDERNGDKIIGGHNGINIQSGMTGAWTFYPFSQIRQVVSWVVDDD